MTLEWLTFRRVPFPAPDIPLPGYLVVAAYVILVVILLVRSHADFAKLALRRWLLLVALLIAAPILARFCVLSLSSDPRFAGLSLTPLGLLPLLAAALWLRSGPTAVVGLLTGTTWALFDTGRITQPFEIALTGMLVSALLNQRYRGTVANVLRQPVVALPVGMLIVAWPLELLGIFATGPAPLMAALEHTVAIFWPTLIFNLSGALIAGVIIQGVLARWPALHPVYEADLLPAPWEQLLSQRMLFTFVPLSTLGIAILAVVVTAISYHLATGLVINQMARNATTAGSQIPFFIQTGRRMIHDLARDEQLLTTDDEARQKWLEHGLYTLSFFEQLLYLGSDQTLLNACPETATLLPDEENQIALVLESGTPTEITAYNEVTGTISITFIAPVVDPDIGAPVGALLGRTALDANALLAPVSNILREGVAGSGEGFLVDDRNRILLYPAHPELRYQVVTFDNLIPVSANRQAQVFRQHQADGTRQLIYLLPVTGYSDWSVAFIVPNEVALALALQLALPTLLLLIVMTGLTLLLTVAFIRQIAAPLEWLVQAADQIAEGHLDRPIEVAGEDEIGRLGRAFEQMRIRLKDRLSEQDRLLSVSRSVASSLELFRAMPPILNSALDVTGAIGVRVTLRTADRTQAYAAGEAAAAMAVLDAQLLDLVEKQGTVVISQLWRASGALDTANLLPRIRALVAMPLRSETQFHGIFWLSYDHDHVFEESEMMFLSTLAGQAAIAVTNARLFNEAEEGRRKLEAVLESTADGMIVVDNQGKVVLINPAAGKYLAVHTENALGRRAAEVIDVPELATLLTNLQEPVQTLELPQRNGRTLLAATSTIVSHEGAITGRVAVLRDITPLKELDNIKTVFLRMVSHDLRSPLTYMRGYASMLALTGTLNQRQQEALAKISDGIESISQMTERLTYLSRLQFGDEADLELSLVDVAELIQEVLPPQVELARQKNIEIHTEIEEKLPLVLADGMLYGHAIMNLVNNAIKYTPEGGRVTVRAYLEDAEHISIAVADNGIGIRPEDQTRLFEAFYRVPQRDDEPPRPRGSGLGLALVRAIAEAHGGKVHVESEFGKGSTFSIMLPLRNPADL